MHKRITHHVGDDCPGGHMEIRLLRDAANELDLLRDALRTIRDAHAEPDQPGASCREGCGGRWPCLAWSEADAALTRL